MVVIRLVGKTDKQAKNELENLSAVVEPQKTIFEVAWKKQINQF